MVADTFPEKEAGHGSVTPFNVTVVYCAFGTPVRFTVHWFGFGPAVIEPVLALPQLPTALEKVKTML
jgi:hypothetical protein